MVTSDRAGRARVCAAARRGFAGVLGVVLVGFLFAAPALAAAPTVTTGAATSVTYNSALLTGTVDPRGSATVVYFQYGTTSSYGAQTAPDQLPAGGANVAISI